MTVAGPWLATVTTERLAVTTTVDCEGCCELLTAERWAAGAEVRELVTLASRAPV